MGSLAVGGAGKTPIVAWLARQLSGPLAILGHGYRGRFKGPYAQVQAPDPLLYGDEAVALYRELPDREIWVARDRAACLKQIQIPHVILDGGSQDLSFPRALEIIALDASAPRRLLPMGPLREPLSALARADLIWLHRVDEPGAEPLPAPWQPQLHSRVKPLYVQLPGGVRRELSWLKGRPLRPISAIARPGSFHLALKRLGAELLPPIVRGDHDALSPRDWSGPALAITTSKDLARLPVGADVVTLMIDLEVEGDLSWLR